MLDVVVHFVLILPYDNLNGVWGLHRNLMRDVSDLRQRLMHLAEKKKLRKKDSLTQI